MKHVNEVNYGTMQENTRMEYDVKLGNAENLVSVCKEIKDNGCNDCGHQWAINHIVQLNHSISLSYHFITLFEECNQLLQQLTA